MKTFLSILLVAVATSGCAQRYNITLNNGNVITTRSKPKLNKETGAYEFKDAAGKMQTIPAIRVQEVAAQ